MVADGPAPARRTRKVEAVARSTARKANEVRTAMVRPAARKPSKNGAAAARRARKGLQTVVRPVAARSASEVRPVPARRARKGAVQDTGPIPSLPRRRQTLCYLVTCE